MSACARDAYHLGCRIQTLERPAQRSCPPPPFLSLDIRRQEGEGVTHDVMCDVHPASLSLSQTPLREREREGGGGDGGRGRERERGEGEEVSVGAEDKGGMVGDLVEVPEWREN